MIRAKIKRQVQIFFILIGTIFISYPVFSQQEKTTIVIAPINVYGFGNGDFAEHTSNMLIEAIIRTYPQFIILERRSLDRVFKELHFTLTYDNTSRSSEVGNLLGADFIILIKVENNYNKTDAGYNNVVTGNRLFNFYGSCKVTVKTLSLKDGSIRDLYNSPGAFNYIDQGDNEQRVGWGLNPRPLLYCFVDLFIKETQIWFNNLPSILQK